MATKEDGFFTKQKQASVIDSSDKSNKFSSLNLNQSNKCSNESKLVQSFSKSNNNKHFGLTVTKDYQETGKSWNNSTKNLSLKTSKNSNLKIEDEKEVQKRWENAKDEGSNKNNSTLSLHIAAYENSFEVSDSSENLPKKSNAFKSVDSLPKLQMTQDSFEFPRQMDNKDHNEPEVQQFSTSQRLFTPNQGASSSNQMQSPRGSSNMNQSCNNTASNDFEHVMTEWHEEMSKDLEKLQFECDHLDCGIIGITPETDIGIVLDIVTSKLKNRYFVIAELKRACVTFVPNDGSSFEHEYIFIGSKVLVKRNLANEVFFVKRINGAYFRRSHRKFDADRGFIAKYIFRYNDIHKKEEEYSIGLIKIANIQSSRDYDNISESDSSDSDVDDDSGSNNDEDEDELEESDDEPIPAHDPANPPNNHEVAASIMVRNILPNTFFKRLIVPRVLMDCRSRDEAFYARENIPFIWLPSAIISTLISEVHHHDTECPWDIPSNSMTQLEHEMPKSASFRGCFIDQNHIFLTQSPQTLALFYGSNRSNGNEIGRDLNIPKSPFDKDKNQYVIFRYCHERNYCPGNNDIPMLFIPTENGLFESRISRDKGIRHFYRHAYLICYVYDRYGVVDETPNSEIAYPIKIHKVNEDGKYMTLVEVYPSPEKGFPARKIITPISGNGFVATEGMIYCNEFDYAPIYYDKNEFNLQLGTFGGVAAIYDSELQRYCLTSFVSSPEPPIKPIFFGDQNEKLCYCIQAQRKKSLIIHEFFGVISYKPFRELYKEQVYFVSYVGDDPKYQTPFAENEEYQVMLKEKEEEYLLIPHKRW